ELPKLVAVRPVPLPVRVVPLVLEPDGDPPLVEGPETFSQAVIELAFPLSTQELLDLRPSVKELVPVSPYRVLAVREHDPFRIARIPRVFSGLVLFLCGGEVDRRQRRSLLLRHPQPFRVLDRECPLGCHIPRAIVTPPP